MIDINTVGELGSEKNLDLKPKEAKVAWPYLDDNLAYIGFAGVKGRNFLFLDEIDEEEFEYLRSINIEDDEKFDELRKHFRQRKNLEKIKQLS